MAGAGGGLTESVGPIELQKTEGASGFLALARFAFYKGRELHVVEMSVNLALF